MANYYPVLRGSPGTSLDRRTARAFARAEERTALELYGLDHEELIARAKIHVLGSLGRQAVHQALDLGWAVQAEMQRNPTGAQLAFDVAHRATREMGEVIERTSWRLR